MRCAFFVAPLLLIAAPVVAQPTLTPQSPHELADPATIDRLADAMQSLSKTLLDLPIGEVRAAIEGRTPTATDRRATLRGESGMTESELRARIAAAKPALQQGVRALNRALPAMMKSLEEAQKSIDRAAANIPDPNYPKR